MAACRSWIQRRAPVLLIELLTYCVIQPFISPLENDGLTFYNNFQGSAFPDADLQHQTSPSTHLPTYAASIERAMNHTTPLAKAPYLHSYPFSAFAPSADQPRFVHKPSLLTTRFHVRSTLPRALRSVVLVSSIAPAFKRTFQLTSEMCERFFTSAAATENGWSNTMNPRSKSMCKISRSHQ